MTGFLSGLSVKFSRKGKLRMRYSECQVGLSLIVNKGVYKGSTVVSTGLPDRWGNVPIRFKRIKKELPETRNPTQDDRECHIDYLDLIPEETAEAK